MDVIQLLITIVVVTILVTIVLAIVTYVAYKLRLAREPSALGRAEEGPRYFVTYPPPTSTATSQATSQATSRIGGEERTVTPSAMEGHATQA